MCNFKTMDKAGVNATPEEVTTNKVKSKAMVFLLWDDESIYGKIFEDLRKADFVIIDEYPETVN